MMKNVSRNKFLLCFRPVVDMDQIVLDSKSGLDSSKTQALAYVSVRKRVGMKHSVSDSSLLVDHSPNKPFPRVSDSSLLVDHSPNKPFPRVSDSSLLVDHSPRRPFPRVSDSSLSADHSPRNPFSRVFKAVLFQTILTKRVRDRKGLCQGGSSLSKHISLLKRSKSLDAIHKENSIKKVLESDSSQESESNSDSPSCSSSIPEPRRNLSKSLSDKRSRTNPNQEKNEAKAQRTEEDNSSLYLLLLISLAATIFWGKLCGILFTSIWLYFLSRRRQAKEENIFRLPTIPSPERDESSKEYKKRVIMEGILERKSQRRSQRQSQTVTRALNL